jgi:hypothetical protein
VLKKQTQNIGQVMRIARGLEVLCETKPIWVQLILRYGISVFEKTNPKGWIRGCGSALWDWSARRTRGAPGIPSAPNKPTKIFGFQKTGGRSAFAGAA